MWIAKSEQEMDDWVASIQASIDEANELVKKGVVILKDDPKKEAARQSNYSLSSWFGGSAADAQAPTIEKTD